MNQGKIWLVVKPSVGLPLIIGGAAVTSLFVHTMILTHTTWVPAFLEGGQKAKSAMIEQINPASVAKLDITSAIKVE